MTKSKLATLASALALVLVMGLARTPLAQAVGTTVSQSTAGNVTIGPSTMEGNLQVPSGQTIKTGWDITIPGTHPAAEITVSNPTVVFKGTCVSGGQAVTFTVSMASAVQSIAANDTSWWPSGDQSNAAVWQSPDGST